ncbi:leucine-rich repeat and calponin homology domain-containing protein 3-like [Dendronephthya gigantea]|uniref:leucine-rich repeat and calponin homology domain-containing protein 3-like n=1 Tax=Dendronephthya gigantea TaxID=151771 RepID=UPI00106DCC7E|nr:leucine-rich repeat and calponin homology domain-containing protein 3-like [Dendronephthya gigantea]
MAGKNISVDRCFFDAEDTGILELCARNLKEFPEHPEECELIDVIECDISKNRFFELPAVVCEFVMLERLNCHHNSIRTIADTSRLTSLTWLNLSKNQLQRLPDHVCGLPLQVLIISNNKLSCIPDEICHLKHIQYLNLSSNELTSLPSSIGELSTLRELNVHQNQLEQLPDEICKLKLEKLDFSCNRITVIPTVFRFLTTLTDLVLGNNPLQSPPAQLCTRGRGHIFKYLAIAAQTQDKGKEATKKYNLSHRDANSILTEANLLPTRKKEQKSSKSSEVERKNSDRGRRSSNRSASLEAELTKAHHLLSVERQFDHTGLDEAVNTEDNSKSTGDELRETSRKLQIQREKQKENARQRHAEESRGYKQDSSRSLDRRKMPTNKKPATVVKVIGSENKSSVVKKVEVSDNLKEDLQDSRNEAKLSKKKLESEKKKIKRQSDSDRNSAEEENGDKEFVPFPGIHKRSQIATPTSAYSSMPNFTVRRMYESAREEFEKVELLRDAIESRLKVRLPDDIPACLADGTVLCHLVNYIRKGTIPSIFVPTPNMPKLTMSKCLKNVDYFLAACLRLGVERDKLCNTSDIVQEKNPGNVWLTVEALLAETKSS